MNKETEKTMEKLKKIKEFKEQWINPMLEAYPKLNEYLKEDHKYYEAHCPYCEPWPRRCPHCGRPCREYYYPYYPDGTYRSSPNDRWYVTWISSNAVC